MCYICPMPQLHCYVPSKLAEKRERGTRPWDISVWLLRQVPVGRSLTGWPAGRLDEAPGAWVGER